MAHAFPTPYVHTGLAKVSSNCRKCAVCLVCRSLLTNIAGLAAPLQESPANLSHVLDNAYSSNLQKYKLHDVLIAKARGASCFDFEHYLLHNPDLRSLGRQSSLWKHFVQFGQFEGRAHKFICNLDFASLATGKGTKNKTVSATRGKAATAAVHAAGSAGDADGDVPVAPAPPKERKKAVVSVSALDPTALLLATAGS